MAKTARHATAPLRPDDIVQSVACWRKRRLHFRASIVLFLKGSLSRKQLRRHPIKIATIHLQGNPKPKMMPPRNLFATSFMISLLLKRRLQRQQKGFSQMINTLTRAATLGALMMAAAFAGAAPAFSQAPSQAQRDAIKSQCRSDYMAHCSSVPPGGEASLQCLQKNMSSLSSGCQGAVRAVRSARLRRRTRCKPPSRPPRRQLQNRQPPRLRHPRLRAPARPRAAPPRRPRPARLHGSTRRTDRHRAAPDAAA